ncbi:MAG: hypothetical protein ACOXZR_02240 [Bacilli bacterium]|jgi:hypothetical protein
MEEGKNLKKRKFALNFLSKEKELRTKQILTLIFFSGVLLIISTYAWFSASVDVRIRFFDLVVSSDTGLFISLDGIDFSSSVEVTVENIISDLRRTYPNHTNQWAVGGLWPVSSYGLLSSNNPKFTFFGGAVKGYRGGQRTDDTTLKSILLHENESNAANVFVAFDIFLKNVSGSPNSDNLSFGEETFINFVEDTTEDIFEEMGGIMNSMRIGAVKVGSVSLDAEINAIQNMVCNNNCQFVIYEPNSTSHTEISIEKAYEYYGVNLIDGIYNPTYAVIKEGDKLELANGHAETGIPLDTEHFRLQNTIKNFHNPIFQIPHGITKLRIYVWIEGQDLDSLETNSKGATLDLGIDFVKDLAGYDID